MRPVCGWKLVLQELALQGDQGPARGGGGWAPEALSVAPSCLKQVTRPLGASASSFVQSEECDVRGSDIFLSHLWTCLKGWSSARQPKDSSGADGAPGLRNTPRVSTRTQGPPATEEKQPVCPPAPVSFRHLSKKTARLAPKETKGLATFRSWCQLAL